LIGLLLVASCAHLPAAAQATGAQAASAQVARVQSSRLPGSSPFFAQEEGLRFEHLSVNDGLSQSGVQHLVQDHYGFLWVGTNDGLNKFDGQFTVYLHDPAEPRSLPNNSITALPVDGEGTLWVGTRDGLAKLVGAPPGLDRDGVPLDRQALAPNGDEREQAIFETYRPHPAVQGSAFAATTSAIEHDPTAPTVVAPRLQRR